VANAAGAHPVLMETLRMKFAIRTEALTKKFGDLSAVDKLSMQVPPGIIYGFLGPNGAGKTTTIHLLLGLLEPNHGRAEILGYDTRSHADEIRRKSGVLLEHPGLYERLNAEDNLEFYGRIHRMPTAVRRSRIKDLLKHLNLWARRDEIVGTWSHGMKKKLAIARALLHRPSLVFLDEPTAGLDPMAAAGLRDDLAELASQEGTTVFLTTHNLSEAERLCQMVGVIRQGRILAVGPPKNLIRDKTIQRLKITGDGFSDFVLKSIREVPQVTKVITENGSLLIDLHNGSEASPLINLIVSNGGRIEEVHRETASLEQVFLTLMDEDERCSAT
jgi:ABC-2 type transport system ATP-binding protein